MFDDDDFFPTYFEKQKLFDILEKSPHREFRSYCILFEIPLSVMNFTIVHTFMKCWTDLNCEFNRFHEFKCDSRLFNGNQKYVMIKLAVFLYKSKRTKSNIIFSVFPFFQVKSKNLVFWKQPWSPIQVRIRAYDSNLIFKKSGIVVTIRIIPFWSPDSWSQFKLNLRIHKTNLRFYESRIGSLQP